MELLLVFLGIVFVVFAVMTLMRRYPDSVAASEAAVTPLDELVNRIRRLMPRTLHGLTTGEVVLARRHGICQVLCVVTGFNTQNQVFLTEIERPHVSYRRSVDLVIGTGLSLEDWLDEQSCVSLEFCGEVTK